MRDASLESSLTQFYYIGAVMYDFAKSHYCLSGIPGRSMLVKSFPCPGEVSGILSARNLRWSRS